MSSPERRASRAINFFALLLIAGEILLAVIFWPVWTFRPLEEVAIFFAGLPLAATLFVLARGIARRVQWVRKASIVLSLLCLVLFPVGTLFGGYLLLELVFRWVGESQEAACG